MSQPENIDFLMIFVCRLVGVCRRRLSSVTLPAGRPAMHAGMMRRARA